MTDLSTREAQRAHYNRIRATFFPAKLAPKFVVSVQQDEHLVAYRAHLKRRAWILSLPLGPQHDAHINTWVKAGCKGEKNIRVGIMDNVKVDVARPIGRILQAVSEYYNVSLCDILSSRRSKHIMRPRHVAMWIARMQTTVSYPEIGRRIGGKDHTTVINGVRRIEHLMSSDPMLRRDVDLLVKIILEKSS